MQLFKVAAVLLAARPAFALSTDVQHHVVRDESNVLQDIVTFDEHSLMIYGQRIMIFAGEFHAFRLPVPDLWLDIFQKVKASGFSAVSFYTDWALLEGKSGKYSAEGVFALEPFFDAASNAGIYLIARPGPYINAEVSGGGFPGWLQRVKGVLRTRAPDYLAATSNYVSSVSKVIAKYQITNGGPVILLQPENEYSGAIGSPFPDPVYFKAVQKQYRDAGIVVPLTSNQAWTQGIFAPGTTTNGTADANVDIYGFDSYPVGFDCAHPTVWGETSLSTSLASSRTEQNISSFMAIPEFQNGAFSPWSGSSFDSCAQLTGAEFQRVFFKNNYAAKVSLLSLYMIFGGTNWGNLGYSVGYSSYDYGAAIAEGREVHREKYSEVKLQANFLRVSPAYLTATPGTLSNLTYTSNPSISVTPLFGNVSATNFYVVRHSDHRSLSSTSYTTYLNTSLGSFHIPQLGGNLLLSGRDSKWMVTDYDLGGTNLLYSTAEIFTWKKFGNQTVLVVYGGARELHELTLQASSLPIVVEGSDVKTKSGNGTAILNWHVSSTRRVVLIGKVLVYILDRNTAYNYWTLDFARNYVWKSYTANVGNTTSVIIQAGYLVRSVHTDGTVLYIEGDLNATVPLRVIGAPIGTQEIRFNNQKLASTLNNITGEWSSTLEYVPASFSLPDLSKLNWRYLDNLPEVKSSYNNKEWMAAGNPTTNNPLGLLTPTSLYASDYGFHSGALIYRGHFTATGNESTIDLWTIGGNAFGSSVWLNDVYLGSWKGADYAVSHNDTYQLPRLHAGGKYVLTVVVDNNGLQGNWVIGVDEMKTPRGIMDFNLSGRPKGAVQWKMTGNLAGEDYKDKVRGPLNEGALYAERQGLHQPNPHSEKWISRSPLTGTNSSGIAYYQTSFRLDLPKGYDIPLTFNFANTTVNGSTSNYQAQLYVNGWQFGKYINNIGPQTKFPVPQGILDYHRTNWVVVELWARDAQGARLTDFKLEAGTPIQTGMKAPGLVKSPSWSKRDGVY